MSKLWIFTVALSISSMSYAQNEYYAEISVDGQKNSGGVIYAEAGAPMQWEIEIFEKKTGQKVLLFKQLHMKLMHMVVVKKDLSKIFHVHPTFDDQAGSFKISLNQVIDDPDNKDTAKIFAEPGEYAVHMEFGVDKKLRRPVPDLVTYHVEVVGDSVDEVLELDMARGVEEVTLYFQNSGERGKYGDPYKLIVHKTVAGGKSGELWNFNVEFFIYEERKDAMGMPVVGYFRLTDLQNWLMMQGHAVLVPLEQNYERVRFEHLHAAKPSDSHVLNFTVFDRNERILTGLNKMWIQTKHRDQVRAFGFTLEK